MFVLFDRNHLRYILTYPETVTGEGCGRNHAHQIPQLKALLVHCNTSWSASGVLRA